MSDPFLARPKVGGRTGGVNATLAFRLRVRGTALHNAATMESLASTADWRIFLYGLGALATVLLNSGAAVYALLAPRLDARLRILFMALPLLSLVAHLAQLVGVYLEVRRFAAQFGSDSLSLGLVGLFANASAVGALVWGGCGGLLLMLVVAASKSATSTP